MSGAGRMQTVGGSIGLRCHQQADASSVALKQAVAAADAGGDALPLLRRDRQTEVGFGDLAIGVLGILCFRFRDRFVLAAVIAVSISYLGDAYGHIHQAVVNDNHDPDNTGLVLWADFIAPIVAMGLYALHERAKREMIEMVPAPDHSSHQLHGGMPHDPPPRPPR